MGHHKIGTNLGIIIIDSVEIISARAHGRETSAELQILQHDHDQVYSKFARPISNIITTINPITANAEVNR